MPPSARGSETRFLPAPGTARAVANRRKSASEASVRLNEWTSISARRAAYRSASIGADAAPMQELAAQLAGLAAGKTESPAEVGQPEVPARSGVPSVDAPSEGLVDLAFDGDDAEPAR